MMVAAELEAEADAGGFLKHKYACAMVRKEGEPQ